MTFIPAASAIGLPLSGMAVPVRGQAAPTAKPTLGGDRLQLSNARPAPLDPMVVPPISGPRYPISVLATHAASPSEELLKALDYPQEEPTYSGRRPITSGPASVFVEQYQRATAKLAALKVSEPARSQAAGWLLDQTLFRIQNDTSATVASRIACLDALGSNSGLGGPVREAVITQMSRAAARHVIESWPDYTQRSKNLDEVFAATAASGAGAFSDQEKATLRHELMAFEAFSVVRRFVPFDQDLEQVKQERAVKLKVLSENSDMTAQEFATYTQALSVLSH